MVRRPTRFGQARADSYVPLSLAVATGFDQGANAPGGLYRLLEQHGHQITRLRESISVRAATLEESVALGVQNAAPVAVSDRHVYVYEFDAPSEWIIGL